MTVASKPRPARPIPNQIARGHRAMRLEGLARWRAWVAEATESGTIPEANDLFSVATLLRIQNPAAALEADIEALREMSRADAGKESCRAALDATIKATGGRAKVVAEIEAAEESLRKLRESLAVIDDGAGITYWSIISGETASRNRRMFDRPAEFVARLEEFDNA